jgi:hypothetical protein
MCLLPEEIKKKLLKLFELTNCKEASYVFSSILKIKESFCENIEECDYVVLPSDFAEIEAFPQDSFFKHKDLIEKSVKHGKKILFFHGSDNNTTFNISEKYGYVFRSSGFLSHHNSNVLGCPTVNLFYNCDTYQTKLSVSFCAAMNTDHLYEVYDGKRYNGIRRKVVNQLQEQSYFDFIPRKRWGAISVPQDDDCGTELDDLSLRRSPEENRKEFCENIKNNLYGLCVRGGGNFSFRLGEVFMMKRIPVLIDTDCILPFRNYIPYETNTVYVTKENSNNFKDVDSVIRSFHDSHTEEELIKIQEENFKIWVEYFTPDFAFKNTCRLLRDLDGK